MNSASPWSSPANGTSSIDSSGAAPPNPIDVRLPGGRSAAMSDWRRPLTAILLPGAPVADAVFEELVPRIDKLKANGYTPGLATVLVGDDGPSARYVGMKMEKADELGCNSPHVHLGEDATTADVIAAVRELNADPGVDAM